MLLSLTVQRMIASFNDQNIVFLREILGSLLGRVVVDAGTLTQKLLFGWVVFHADLP